MTGPVASRRAPTAARLAALEAQKRGDWAELLEQAGRLRALAPNQPHGYVLGITALKHLGRRADMRAALSEALRRFPDHRRLRTLHSGPAAPVIAPARPADELRAAIEAALERADWPVLAELCAQLRDVDPDDVRGYQLGTRAWRGRKRLRMAEKVSSEGAARFPDHPAMLTERAAVLRRINRLDEAAACYARLRALLPNSPIGFARGASLLDMAGRFDEAEVMLGDALARWPTELSLLVQSAVLASRRQDFAQARQRWEQVRAIAPDDPRLRNFDGSLTLAEQMHSVAEGGADPDEVLVDESLVHADDAAVLRRFEGLGGNCEFGLVQRLAGIEPLGLLRFAGISAAELIRMLNARLDGVGGEATTVVFANVHQEYMLADTRYFRTHTFMPFGGADEAALLGKLRKRTVFLRDKLLAELRQGNKIFVFRPADGVLEDDTMLALHRAVRRLGPARLVCVRNGAASGAPSGAPNGVPNGGSGEPATTLIDRGDGLLVATMPGHDQGLNLGFVRRARYAHWLAVCRAALAT